MNPQDVCASCAPTKYAALREENARLKAEWEMPCQRCEGYRRERDEARAEWKDLREHSRNEAEQLRRERDEARAKLEKVVGAGNRLASVASLYPVESAEAVDAWDAAAKGERWD